MDLSEMIGAFDDADRIWGGRETELGFIFTGSLDEKFNIYYEMRLMEEHKLFSHHIEPFEGRDGVGKTSYCRFRLSGKSPNFWEQYIALSAKAVKAVGDVEVDSVRYVEEPPVVVLWTTFLISELMERNSPMIVVEPSKYGGYATGVVKMPLLASKWLLQQLHAECEETKPKKRRKRSQRKGVVDANLTEKQAEAFWMVQDCNGNIAEAARRLGKDRKTIEQHYKRACEILGKKAVSHIEKQNLPHDQRGQAMIASNDLGPAYTGPKNNIGAYRDERSPDSESDSDWDSDTSEDWD
ncbi:Sigma-70, region 4 [Poriferisphaera corsica]|uniref:Sigma-70, region 4 n=1 Tax=Poriferisphaera corsica TaxID=2528020 RepID=A0A517YXF4_9BACT|nr:sigma-70 region 4 domain-containing protein [Poriferisphaera corsica]QDU34899.1 Sigma-70, region 4 [Poriferisphaera corsica]